MFTHVYLCLTMLAIFINVYVYVFTCLLVFIRMFTTIYLCIIMYVYPCLLLFTYVYTCLLMFFFRALTNNGSDMVAAFKVNNNEDDIAESALH